MNRKLIVSLFAFMLTGCIMDYAKTERETHLRMSLFDLNSRSKMIYDENATGEMHVETEMLQGPFGQINDDAGVLWEDSSGSDTMTLQVGRITESDQSRQVEGVSAWEKLSTGILGAIFGFLARGGL